jgi:hypothetical protein
MEQFKYVKGYESLYMVSNLGNVLSLRQSKIMRKLKTGSGYHSVTLYKDGKKKKQYIHRLVLTTFTVFKSEMQVNHIDGNKLNNKLENLEWVNAKRNVRHAIELGLIKTGEQSYASKLSSDDILK